MKILPFWILLVLGSCSSHDELTPPSNPLDPDNPVYIAPLASILFGPAEGSTIDTTVANFEWSGNSITEEFSWRLDNSTWSDWSLQTSIRFEYLDEGPHRFEVLGRGLNGDSQLEATQRSFTVDAVSAPSLIVKPYLQNISIEDTIRFELCVEEAADIIALECVFHVNTAQFNTFEFELTSYLWSGQELEIIEQDESKISVWTSSVQSSQSTFSGNSPVIIVSAIPTGSTQTGTHAGITIESARFVTSLDEISGNAIIRSGFIRYD